MKFLCTTINVENLDESIAFYTGIVGLRVLNRLSADPGIEMAFLGNGTDNETLIELLADSGVGTVSYSEFISIGFAVDSVERKLASLQREGIPVHNGPYETSAMRYFCIRDPDGLQVRFFSENSFGSA